MTTNSLYAGRKFLGPLDRAVINAQKSREKFVKTMILQEIINDLEEVENQLKDETLSRTDGIMLRMVRTQLNKQLCEFLGVPYDSGTSEDSKVSD